MITRELFVILFRIRDICCISTIKLEAFAYKLSSEPILVNIRSHKRKEAYSAGTNIPAWAIIDNKQICPKYVDFPLILGPVIKTKLASTLA
jgi:hypothetical protein